MDLTDVIEMPREEAREAYEDYAAALKRRHSDEDAAIARGYKALAEGQRLLSLRQAIATGGEDDQYRPRIAIAPATAEWVYLARRADGSVEFSVVPHGHRGPGRASSRGRLRLPAGTLGEKKHWRWDREDHTDELLWDTQSYGWRAMVPVVPPRLRPTRALTTYHVLFEAEWGKAPRPPGDPALLKHLAGDLWVVLAEWDLTPLEQAVLAQRLTGH